MEIFCRCFELHCRVDVRDSSSKAATKQKQNMNETSGMERDLKTKMEQQQSVRWVVAVLGKWFLYTFELLWLIVLYLQFFSCMAFEVEFLAEQTKLTETVILDQYMCTGTEQVNNLTWISFPLIKNLWIVSTLFNVGFAKFVNTGIISDCKLKRKKHFWM